VQKRLGSAFLHFMLMRVEAEVELRVETEVPLPLPVYAGPPSFHAQWFPREGEGTGQAHWPMQVTAVNNTLQAYRHEWSNGMAGVEMASGMAGHAL